MRAPGSIVGGRYRIEELLGRGGMGTVYRARHVGLARDVALKILDRADVTADRDARFEREARATARLEHPGIVRVLDFGRAVDGSRFLAMDLLAGPTLRRLADRTPRFGVLPSVDTAIEILAALSHAHAHGVLHRDVKPENVMRHDGRWVLIDFGLARLRDEATLTARGRCFGSVSYIAPERLAGGSAHGVAADLYSVGVMLYEMLAGSRPFVGDTPLEVARAHLTRVPRPLRAIRPDVPAALDAAIVRAMSKRADRRFADARAMIDALEAAIAPVEPREPVAVAEPSTFALPRVVEPAPRRLWAWLAYGSWRRRRARLAV